jgi:hypothetical protein
MPEPLKDPRSMLAVILNMCACEHLTHCCATRQSCIARAAAFAVVLLLADAAAPLRCMPSTSCYNNTAHTQPFGAIPGVHRVLEWVFVCAHTWYCVLLHRHVLCSKQGRLQASELIFDMCLDFSVDS